VRKLFGGLGAFVAVLLVTAVGVAYFPGNGSGGGTATAGNSPLGVDVTAAVNQGVGDPETALYPGDVSDVEITVEAPEAWPDNRRARIGSASATVDSGSLPVGCLAADFVFTPSGFSPGFVTGTTPLVINAGTLTFTDTAADQSACSGASLTINATVGA
jgi:hypothetical protein